MKKLILPLLLFAPLAEAAITLRSTGNFAADTDTNGQVTCDFPASYEDGDVAILHGITYHGSTDLQMRTPSGWTALTAELEHPTNQSVISQRLFYKVVSGTQSDFTLESERESDSVLNQRVACQVSVWDGVDNTTVEDVAETTQTGTGTTLTAPDVTTTTDNAVVLRAYAHDLDGALGSFPDGTSVYDSRDGGGSDGAMGLEYATKTPEGAAGTTSATVAFSASWVAISAVLRPADAGAPTPDITTNLTYQADINTRGRTDNTFYDHVADTGTAETTSGSPSTFTGDSSYTGLNCDGTDDIVEHSYPTWAHFDSNNSFTIAVRARVPVDDAAEQQLAFGSTSTNNPQIQLGTQASGDERRAYMRNNNGDDTTATNINIVGAAVDDGNEHVFVFVKNGATSGTLYVDGSAETADTQFSLASVTLNTMTSCAHKRTSTTYSDSEPLWVAVWNRALTSTDVGALHASANPFAAGGSECSISDASPLPGGTVTFTQCPAFAGNITTLTSVEGDAITAQAGATTTSASFVIPVRDEFSSTGAMNNTEWGVDKVWTVGDGTTTENVTLKVDPPSIAGTDFTGQIDRTTDPGDSMWLLTCCTGSATGDDYYFEENSGAVQINADGVPTGIGAADLRWYDDVSASSGTWSAITTFNFVEGTSTGPTLSAFTSYVDYGQPPADDNIDFSMATNDDSGTLYWCITTNATRTAAEIKAGTGCTNSGSASPVSVGVQAFTSADLADNTYYVHAIQTDAFANDSNILVGGTIVIDTTAPTLSNIQIDQEVGGGIRVTITSNEAGGIECGALTFTEPSTNDIDAVAVSKAMIVGANTLSIGSLPTGTDVYGYCYGVDDYANASQIYGTAGTIEVVPADFTESEDIFINLEQCSDNSWRAVGTCP